MDTDNTHSKFPATRWTLVVSAHHKNDIESSAALEALCKLYWRPLFCFARRIGHTDPDAKDLTQGFFAYLLQRHLFSSADPERGRFRTFLLTAFKRFMRDVRDHDCAEKRGGKVEMTSLDSHGAENLLPQEPTASTTPEAEYDKMWALATLQAARGRLAAHEANDGRGEIYRELEAFLLTDPPKDLGYAKAEQLLGRKQPAIRILVHRLRKKLSLFLRQQIAETLFDPSGTQLEEEVAALKAALRS